MSNFEKIINKLESQKDVAHDESMAEIVSTRIWNKAIDRAVSIVKSISKDIDEESGLVFVPCKIGDEVYGIRRCKGKKSIVAGIVSEIYFSQENQLIITVYHVCRGFWNESVFATYEAAEAALKETEK